MGLRKFESKIYGNYGRAAAKYGFFSGLIMMLVIMFRYWIIYPIKQPVSYTENIALFVLMIGSLVIYKRNLEEGRITFKEAFLLSFGVGVIASIMYGMFLYIYASFIDMEFCNRCFDFHRSLSSNANLSDEEIHFITKPSSIAFSGILLSTTVSILWAFIMSIMLRNEKAPIANKKLKKKK